MAFERARAEESRERAIVIAKVLVVGIRQGDATSGAGFAEDNGEPRRPVNAGDWAERDALEHREDGRVQTDAEREHADDGERKDRVLRERANRVADVAQLIVQGVDPPRRPDAAGRFGGQRDVAEILQRRELRAARIGAVRLLLVSGNRQVSLDFCVEIVLVEALPLQSLEPGR